MPGIDRAVIIQGPAQVRFGGQTFWSKGNVVLKPVFARFPIEVAALGKIDERFQDRRYTVTFEPSGRFNAALALVLWPYQTTTVGSSVFGATDSPLVIHGRDGIRYTLHAAAVTKMPNIQLGVSKTVVGSMEFTAILKRNTDPTDAAAYYTVDSAPYPGDALFNAAEITTKKSINSWGLVAPWFEFETENGFDVSFSLKLAEVKVDGFGTIDMTLQGLDIEAKGVPVGPVVAEVMTALKGNQNLGTSLSGPELILNNGGGINEISLHIYAAAMVDSEARWGATDKRIGQTTWVSTGNVGSAFLIIAADN